MMQLDTVQLWKIAIVMLIYRGFFLYVSVLANFAYIAVIVLYVSAYLSVRVDGSKLYMAFISMPIDLGLTIFVFGINLDSIKLMFLPLFLLFLITIPLYLQTKKEVALFDRTILSLNHHDRLKARKALETLDPLDIAEVAKYRDWQSINS